MTTITLKLTATDAEPILRTYAEMAAKYGALVDYITRKTCDRPGSNRDATFADDRAEWNEKFLRAKRVVESFGIEYEPTSEEETITIHYPHWKNEKRRIVKVGNLQMVSREGGEQDMKKPEPLYRKNIHADACRAAADRAVRRWRSVHQQ